MADQIENLMLEHLKRFQATLDRMEHRLGEFTIRQTETHTAVLGLRRDQLNDAELSAHVRCRSISSAIVSTGSSAASN